MNQVPESIEVEKVPGQGEAAGPTTGLRRTGLTRKNFGESRSIACHSQRALSDLHRQTSRGSFQSISLRALQRVLAECAVRLLTALLWSSALNLFSLDLFTSSVITRSCFGERVYHSIWLCSVSHKNMFTLMYVL